MKTLVISDTHLTHKFDIKKWLFLKSIIKQTDAVIINGDFWDYYESTFEKFITSKWSSTLFPLLKSKNTIYIYGNRDQKNWCNEKVSLFSTEQYENYSFSSGERCFKIEHGDKLKQKAFASRDKYMSLLKLFKISMLIDILEKRSYLKDPERFTSPDFAEKNNQVKSTLNDTDCWQIVSDTHLPELDTENKFANPGFIKFGFASYLVIYENNIDLIKTYYK